jgi:hypothetical protein
MRKSVISLVVFINMVPFCGLHSQTGESKPKMVIFNSREKKIAPVGFTSLLPVMQWKVPDSLNSKTDFPVIEISGLVFSDSRLAGLKLLVNNEVVNDRKSFSVLPGSTENEYMITRPLTLQEGINEIVIEASNNYGPSLSDKRTIVYTVPRIDASYTEKRLALVIGNSDYIFGNTLSNPVNDAIAIRQSLAEVGFKVLYYVNADQKTMKRAMDEFGEQLKNFTVGLFYYAGHGIQVKGNNYLIPVDAALKVEQDVDYDCIDAGRLLGKMEAAGTTTNIVILDACRNNPFERQWSGRASGQGNGLAFMNAPSGSIIAYATSPGKTASDGSGKNGLYTSAILEYIKVPGLSIEEFFKNVRTSVERNSNRTQTPWESTSLKGNFYFRLK